MSVQATTVSGICAPKFARVKEAFEQNFRVNDEIGASLSVYTGGDCLVDIWGGHLDRAKSLPWQDNTLVNVWSSTKGVMAACYAIAVGRGQLDYDDEVARYWPEFSEVGNGAIRVCDLLSHQAGLCGFASPANIEDFYDVEAASARLISADPFWSLGAGAGYHAISIGALGSALFKRVEGRYIRQFVFEELNSRLGLDLFVGLPEPETHRCTPLIAPVDLDSADAAGQVEMSPEQIAALANPLMDAEIALSAAWRQADIPSANGHATARGLAALYGSMAVNDGRVVDRTAVGKAALSQWSGTDRVLGLEAEWANGFLLNRTGLYGPNPEAFGHSGWGGSFAFADPIAGFGVAYTMNRMGTDLVDDPRNKSIIDAIYASL